MLRQRVIMLQKMFEKILVPVDGSHSCLRAREVAASIAKKFSSTVTIMHVISHEFMRLESQAHNQSPRLILPPLVLDELDRVYEKTGREIIRNAEEFFRKENVEVKTILVRAQDPAQKILQTVEESKCDLLVIGNTSETQHDRFALGSIAEKVSLYAECPVFITKKKTEINKLLVPVDGSRQAGKALESAILLCQHFKGAKMTILNVMDDQLFKLQPKYAQEVGQEILRQASVKAKELDHDKRLEFGDAAHTIMKVAKQEDYDLIVLGSRGISSLKRYLLGSVSADVSVHAQRSVLIVR